MGAGLIWIVVNSDGASDKLKDNIDHGNFAEANALKYQMDSMAEKVKSMVSEHGGTAHILMPDRLVLEVPMSVAEDIPNVLEGYKQFFGSLMAVGMGLDLSEAAAAALKAVNTHEIELFDPTDPSFKMYKNDGDDDFLEMPPNLFDPLLPKMRPQPKEKPKYVAPPGIEQQMQQEAAYLQSMVEQMGGGQPPAPPQQDPNQQDQQPRDLLEALHGKQIPGREDPNAEGDEEESDSKKPPKKEKKESKSDNDDDSEDSDSDEDSGDESKEKLAGLLGTVKQHIPQIMQLQETNPDAFKQTLNLIHKLIAMGKSRSGGKKTEKSEINAITEELNKRLTYPVGTIKGRRKKVVVDGKAKWRSVGSGQLQDTKGQPISVREVNAAPKDGDDGIKG